MKMLGINMLILHYLVQKLNLVESAKKKTKKGKESKEMTKTPNQWTYNFKKPRGRAICKNCFQESNNKDVPIFRLLKAILAYCSTSGGLKL